MLDALLGLARALGDDSARPAPAGTAEAIASATVDDGTEAMLRVLRDAGGAVVVVGESALNHPQASWIRALARHVAAAVGGRLALLPQGANAIGLAAHGVLPAGLDARRQLEEPRRGYLLYGIEPQFDFVDNERAMRALGQASAVVAFAAYAPEALRNVAQLILPIGLLPEIDATLRNALGQDQQVAAAARAPGESRPGWRVLRALGEALALPGFEFTELAELRGQMAPGTPPRGTGLAPRPQPVSGLQRVATQAIYRADAVLRRSAPLNAHPLTRGAALHLHPEDALALGLADGAIAHLDDGRGRAALPVRLTPRVARGAAWIESGYDATAPFAPTGAALTINRA
jgi:NADH-quinone oxidoreductase subunit G